MTQWQVEEAASLESLHRCYALSAVGICGQEVETQFELRAAEPLVVGLNKG